MLLLRLFIFRLGPLVVLGVRKAQKQKKQIFLIFLLVYGISLYLAVKRILSVNLWKRLMYVVLGFLPQGIFYIAAMWMLFRCIWYSWSNRVWKRIFRIAFVAIVFGILTEFYINPQILDFFVKKI